MVVAKCIHIIIEMVFQAKKRSFDEFGYERLAGDCKILHIFWCVCLYVLEKLDLLQKNTKRVLHNFQKYVEIMHRFACFVIFCSPPVE